MLKYRQEIGASSSRSAGFGGGRAVVFKGAALMGAAALISKALGTLQKIPLQNIAGDRVFGIYNAVAPLYQLLLAIVSSGFPVAISILVAEREVHGDHSGAGRILRASAMLLFGYGAVLFVPMWGGADVVAAWMGDTEAAQAIRMSALALWVVPVMAALRGYYQGRNEMLPSAASQLSEQTVRVAGMLTLLAIGWHYGWGDAKLAAGATAGSAIGGTAGLAVMVGIWLRERRGVQVVRRLGSLGGQASGEWTSLQALMRRLIMLAIPVTLGALAVPMLGVVDSFTVPRLLRAAGDEQAEAMALFGLYSRGQPLVQLVVMVAGAMGTALIPALAAARLHGDKAAMREHATFVLRFAWALGAAAAIGLAALAEPINVMLYADDEGTRTFALVGCTALAGTVSALTAAVLQGLGAVRAPALFMLAAAALKAALNAALVPAFGIAGAACAGIAALMAAALLGTGAVRRAAGAAMPARRTAGIALALAVMAAVLVPAERGAASLLGPLPPRAAAAALALGGVALGGAVFLAAVLRFGGITARELRALPGGGALAAKLQALRLLPRD
ncbi:O-antigen/teichoic acid export membrane protein [Paenibacillus taihuensis]|uniref:O-antigen/teichoic acid export membrane protein n=1 Tax=Paenibacillus taihuensis TaxID=1156355 RepID=A0A3D9R2E4_9BACL|nr:O-antigen/teichoic acid export membrane protein [Paenibacillus taihuensis]